MTETLRPGVYVEEIAAGPRPIEGVGTSTAGLVRLLLVDVPVDPPGASSDAIAHEWRRLRDRVHARGWTDANASDPGVTLVDLLAYFAESLLFEGAQPETYDRDATTRLAAASLALLAGCGAKDRRVVNATAWLTPAPDD